MELGIIGYPASGRSSLFAALTRGRGEAGAGLWRRGAVKMPDPRLNAVSQLLQPKKTVAAEIRYADVTAEPGEWRGALLPQLVEVDAFLGVVRAFANLQVPHPKGSLDPHRDLAAMEEEMLLSDLSLLERRLERLVELERRAKPLEREVLAREASLLRRLKESLESGKPLREQEIRAEEVRFLEGFPLLTSKPLLAVVNIGEEALPQAATMEEQWRQQYARPRFGVVALCAKLEAELAQLSEEEAAEFRTALNAPPDTLERLVQASYQLLGLVTFFTVASGEVRAWAVPRDIPAVKAAGRVHTDMERGFIRAEVIPWQELLRVGGMAEARRHGLLRLEGKNYPVQDGDVITFLFNI